MKLHEGATGLFPQPEDALRGKVETEHGTSADHAIGLLHVSLMLSKQASEQARKQASKHASKQAS